MAYHAEFSPSIAVFLSLVRVIHVPVYVAQVSVWIAKEVCRGCTLARGRESMGSRWRSCFQFSMPPKLRTRTARTPQQHSKAHENVRFSRLTNSTLTIIMTPSRKSHRISGSGGSLGVPQGTLSVASGSNRSAMDTLWEDVDSLWDDVGSMRREFSALVEDVYDTKEEVSEIQDALVEEAQEVERQGQATAQVQSSVALLRNEVGSLNVQLSIVKEKNQQMELMLALLMQANPDVMVAYESIIAKKSPRAENLPVRRELHMERSFTRKLDQGLVSTL